MPLSAAVRSGARCRPAPENAPTVAEYAPTVVRYEATYSVLAAMCTGVVKRTVCQPSVLSPVNVALASGVVEPTAHSAPTWVPVLCGPL